MSFGSRSEIGLQVRSRAEGRLVGLRRWSSSMSTTPISRVHSRKVKGKRRSLPWWQVRRSTAVRFCSDFDAVDGYQSSNCVDYDDRYDPTKNAGFAMLSKGKRDGVPEKVLLRPSLEPRPLETFLPCTISDWQGVAYETVSGQQSNNASRSATVHGGCGFEG